MNTEWQTRTQLAEALGVSAMTVDNRRKRRIAIDGMLVTRREARREDSCSSTTRWLYRLVPEPAPEPEPEQPSPARIVALKARVAELQRENDALSESVENLRKAAKARPARAEESERLPEGTVDMREKVEIEALMTEAYLATAPVLLDGRGFLAMWQYIGDLTEELVEARRRRTSELLVNEPADRGRLARFESFLSDIREALR